MSILLFKSGTVQKIKLLQPCMIAGQRRLANEQIDVDAALASDLITRGAAEAVGGDLAALAIAQPKPYMYPRPYPANPDSFKMDLRIFTAG